MGSVFWDYYTDERQPRNLIRLWYAQQDERARASFDAVIRLLESNPDSLDSGAIKSLERDCTGLWEVIINIKDKRPYRHIRPIGLWHPDERIFIFLGAFEKSGRAKVPNDPCKDALKYKAWHEAGRGEIDEHI